MRKLFLYILALVLLTGCYGIEKGSVKPTDFTITVSECLSTRATFVISPGNQDAWYYYVVVDEEAYTYNMSDEEFTQSYAESLVNSYNHFYSADEDNISRFSDVFCYQGNCEFVEKFLRYDMGYRLGVIQMDPYKMEPIGTATCAFFHTGKIDFIPLYFSVSVEGDGLTLTPSDPDATYIWDYEDAGKIREEYAVPSMYFRNLVYMYQDYDFINHLLCNGPSVLDLSQESKKLKDGGEYTLLAAGFANGEINTKLYNLMFFYNNGKIEIIDEFLFDL